MREWEKKDPITKWKARLIDDNILTEGEAEEIEQKISREIEEALDFAEKSPFPSSNEVLENVFMDI